MAMQVVVRECGRQSAQKLAFPGARAEIRRAEMALQRPERLQASLGEPCSLPMRRRPIPPPASFHSTAVLLFPLRSSFTTCPAVLPVVAAYMLFLPECHLLELRAQEIR